jgi:Ca2+-binding RTX toxin-like protein
MALKNGTKQNDILNGTDGTDMLIGKAGDDTLFGGNGNDTLDAGEGADELLGGNGNDKLLPGQYGADAIDGGKGIDTVSYANFSTTKGVYVQLHPSDLTTTDLDSAGDTIVNVERFIGSEGSDHFFLYRPMPGKGYYVFGGDGDDQIRVNGGVLRGGQGDDQLLGDTDGETVEYFWLELGKGVDKIGDMTNSQDKIRISGEEFGIGALLNSDELFYRNADANATGAKAQFIYRNDLDQLYFDADGTGAKSAVLLAEFNSNVSLSVDDFQIV